MKRLACWISFSFLLAVAVTPAAALPKGGTIGLKQVASGLTSPVLDSIRSTSRSWPLASSA